MSNGLPKRGSFYIVQQGDDLRKISGWAYGYDRAYDLIRSNAALLQPRISAGRIDVNIGGLPVVYIGERLWIPKFD